MSRAAVGQHTKCQPMISVLLIMPCIVSVQDHAQIEIFIDGKLVNVYEKSQ